MANRKKKLLISLSISVIVSLLLLHFYAPRVIIEIKNPLVNLFKKKHSTPPFLKFEKDSIDFKQLHFTSEDQLNITGYIVYAKNHNAKGTIILLHGIRSSKEHFRSVCKKLSSAGFNSVALDLRAHGQSEGDFCTFGEKEKKDISLLINHLNIVEKITSNIGIWGQSLGGAVAIQSMAFDKRISFGIIESTFSDFSQITHDYFRNNLGFNIPFLTNYLIYRAGKIADFNPEKVSPFNDCAKIEQPILMVHGTADDRINIQYGIDNFNHLKSNKKTLLKINNADHLNVWQVGGKKYFLDVINFINNSIK